MALLFLLVPQLVLIEVEVALHFLFESFIWLALQLTGILLVHVGAASASASSSEPSPFVVLVVSSSATSFSSIVFSLVVSFFLLLLLLRRLLLRFSVSVDGDDGWIKERGVRVANDFKVFYLVHFELHFRYVCVAGRDFVVAPASLGSEAFYLDEGHGFLGRVYFAEDSFVAHEGCCDERNFAAEEVFGLHASSSSRLLGGV